MPASSAAIEAMVDLAVKKEQDEAQKRLHPMFRRTSTTSSLSSAPRDRSTSAEVKSKGKRGTKRKASNKGRSKGIKEEPVEVLDSDDEPEAEFDTKRVKLEDTKVEGDAVDSTAADDESSGNANR